jgi:hypothetical protein
LERKINITRSIDDLKKAYKLYHKKRSLRGKIISVILLIIGFNFAYEATKGKNPADKFLLAYIFFVIACTPIWNRYNAAKKGLKNNPSMLDTETLTITDQELESKTEGATGTIKWFAFVDAIVSEDMILLFVSRTSFLILPKHFFSVEEFSFLLERANEIALKNNRTPARRRTQ